MAALLRDAGSIMVIRLLKKIELGQTKKPANPGERAALPMNITPDVHGSALYSGAVQMQNHNLFWVQR